MTALALGVPHDAIARLRRHPLIAALTQGRPRRAREHAVYFDTADLALARAGIALWVRRVGRASVQSVARIATNGAHASLSTDTVLTDDAPDLARIPDETLREAVARSAAGRPLAPAFEVDLARETRVLREDANELSFALDVGAVHTAGGDAPLGTLVFELRSGDPSYPVQLAIELLDAFPLEIATRHPAARARELLLGEPARARRAEAVAAPEDATLEVLLVAVVESCLAQITGNQEAALLGADPEGVHQLRVGLRRLRSALAFFGDVIPERQRAALREQIRSIARELGPARELDVFAAEWLAPLRAARPDDGVLKHFAELVDAERAAEAERVRAMLRSQRYPRLVLELRRWVARRAWREQPLSALSASLFLPARDVVADRLERRHRRTRKWLRRLAALPLAERHGIRIAAKKMRYAAEFCACLFQERRARRYVRRLGALQEALGIANDASAAEAVAARLATRLGGRAEHERAAGVLIGWTARAGHAEVARLPALAERFEAARRFWPRPAAKRAPTP